MTLKCRAVLVDLDGTLVDSAPRILQVWETWGRRTGIPFERIMSVVHGRRSIDTIRLVAPSLPAEREAAALEAEEISDMRGVRLYAGATELMEELRQSPHAIVTSGSRRAAEARLRYVGLRMPKVLVSGDDVQVGKPAPDAYVLAARRLGAPPCDCVVIEDSPVGVEAAKAASMRVVAVTSTHSAKEFLAADAIVAELAAIGIRSTEGMIELILRP